MSSEKYKERIRDAAENAARSAAAYRAKGRAREVFGSVNLDAARLVGDAQLEAKGHRQDAEAEKDRASLPPQKS